MSLDIAILGANGSPKKQVSIGVDEHYQLMQFVGENGGLLRRLDDYYGDIEFEPAELGSLIRELTALRARCGDDKQLISFLDGFIELAELATNEQQPLVAIAD